MTIRVHCHSSVRFSRKADPSSTPLFATRLACFSVFCFCYRFLIVQVEGLDLVASPIVFA